MFNIEVHLIIDHWSFKTFMSEYCSCSITVICLQYIIIIFAVFCILGHLLLLIIPTAVYSSATICHGEVCVLLAYDKASIIVQQNFDYPNSSSYTDNHQGVQIIQIMPNTFNNYIL